MNNVTKTRLMLSSLSVFRGIMKRSVPKAYYNLLLSLDKQPDEFLRAYGEFYSLVSERGCSDKLAYSMTEAALFDENCFTLAAAGGTDDRLPVEVLRAVKRDCEAILSAAILLLTKCSTPIHIKMKLQMLLIHCQDGSRVNVRKALKCLTVL